MSHPVPSVASAEVLPPSFVAISDFEDPLCELLFNQSPLGVGVVEWLGDDIRYLALNPASATRLGCPAQQARGRRARDLGVPADARAQWSLLAADAQRRGGPAQLEWTVNTLEGMKSFRTTVVPVPAPAGSAPRFAYMTEELTRLRALEMRVDGLETSKSLAAEVEQPLAQAIHELGIARDEVETAAAYNPELELEDAAAVLREGIRNARRAHRRLHELLWG